MKCATSSARSSAVTPILALFAAILATVFTTSCGSGGSTPTPPEVSGNTQVTVLLSSTANDQVSQFDVELQSLTLTSQSGKAVSLLPSQQSAEFMHLNGEIEPFGTVTVPQEIYTSATATLAGAVFECLAQVPGEGIGTWNYSIVNGGPTINLPTPITVTGSNMALLLNMEVSSSALFPSCSAVPAFQGFSMTPTFTLTPLYLSTSPTNYENGKVNGLVAEISSVGATGSSLKLTIAGGPYGTTLTSTGGDYGPRTISASFNSATVFQGVSGASALVPGMFLNLDGAIQSDGSLLAIRVEVEDSSQPNDSSGPVMFVDNVVSAFEMYGRTELGTLQTINGQSGIYLSTPNFDIESSTVFQISGQFTNLQSLPFVPSFNASNMVAGQNVDVTSGTFVLVGGLGTPTNTITLVPQTIDGQIVGSQQSGNFTDYTVSLASYDLFPTLAVQPAQTTLLSNPSQMEVYVDGKTQQLNTQALTAGSTLRFYGLVFNDNGTLRMDCAQVNDGVPLTTPANTNSSAQIGRVETVRRQGLNGLQQTITTMTPSR